MESALRGLGTCEMRAPAWLVRNMTLTVRSLEKEAARRAAAANPVKQPEKRDTLRGPEQSPPKKKM